MLVVTGASSASWWTRLRATQAPAFQGRSQGDELERRLACFRDARHVEIPEAGHMVHFDQPDSLNQAIEHFLADRTPSPPCAQAASA